MRPVDDSTNDADAMRLCRSGNIAGLEALVVRYQLTALRIAYLLTDDRSLTEDIVQDSFLLVYQKCQQFHDGSLFAPWFHRIVLNIARQRLRSATRHKESSLDALREADIPLLDASQDADPVDVAERTERIAAVVDILRHLTMKQREVLVLRYYCDYSETDIARLLDSPAGTVRWRLHAALRAFKRASERLHPWLSKQSGETPALLMPVSEGGTQL